MKFKVELARLVRETRVVVVDCDSEEDLNSRLDEVYDKDDDLGTWDEDAMWGCSAGTHTVIGECPAEHEHLYPKTITLDEQEPDSSPTIEYREPVQTFPPTYKPLFIR